MTEKVFGSKMKQDESMEEELNNNKKVTESYLKLLNFAPKYHFKLKC